MLATAPCTLASAPVISFQCGHWRALKANPLTQYLIKEILLIKFYFYSSLTWWKGVYLLSRLYLSGAPLPVTARADEQSHFGWRGGIRTHTARVRAWIPAVLETVFLPLEYSPSQDGGGGGIRTHGPLRVSGFLDRCTKPGYATPPNTSDSLGLSDILWRRHRDSNPDSAHHAGRLSRALRYHYSIPPNV